jgi:hypothetical protein
MNLGFRDLVTAKTVAVYFSSRRPGLDSSPVCVELRCTIRDLSSTSASPFIAIPKMPYIRLRLTAAFINRTSWLILGISKQINAVSSIGERWTENYLHPVLLCSRGLVTVFIAVVWFHSWEQHWYNSRHYCCVILQHKILKNAELKYNLVISCVWRT